MAVLWWQTIRGRKVGTATLRLSLAVVAFAVMLGVSLSVSAQGAREETYFVVSGDAENSYTLGGSRFFTSGDWRVDAYDGSGDGVVDVVSFQIRGLTPGGEPRDWSVTLGTNGTGRNLTRGFYPQADSATGHPYMVIGGEGFGDHYPGSFTVLAADYELRDGAFSVRRFAVRFEYGNWPIFGVLSYQAPQQPVVMSATYSRPKGALKVSGENLSSATMLEVDGRAVPATATKGGIVKATGLALNTGNHSIATVFPDGTRSAPLVVNFDLGLPAPSPEDTSIEVTTTSGIGPSTAFHGRPSLPFVEDADGNGFVDYISLSFPDSRTGYAWVMQLVGFPVRDLVPGDDIVTGTDFGQPHLEITHPGLECRYETGRITVLESVADTTQGYPKLIRFRATFQQSCGSGGPTLEGSIDYNGLTRPVMARARYDRGARRLTVYGLYFSRDAMLVVDGRVMTGGSVTSGKIVLDGVDLRGRVHEVHVVNGDGLVTRPFMFGA